MFLHINIKSRVFRLVLYIGAMAHVRHWRGHGVHSPFVYSLVRKVFMKRGFLAADRTLYEELRRAKTGRRAARQLQNLYNYCKYTSFTVSDIKHSGNEKTDLHLLMPSLQPEKTLQAIEQHTAQGAAIAIMQPRQSRQRIRMCRRIVNEKRFLSIDNRRYILLFANPALPRQHFKL